MKFSSRTNWHRQPNRLSELLEQKRRAGRPIYDLTISNPTECGIEYPREDIVPVIANSQVLHYKPDPRGLLSAREAVAEYYREKDIHVDPANVFLTSSTSEAYSHVFKLLCNVGDSIAVPTPSYPLFDYLAQVNDVETVHYKLRYDSEWYIDIDSLSDCVIGSLKAIVIVNPHNPTGMFLKKDEYEQIKAIARRNELALIVDEVFIDYPFDEDALRFGSTAGESDVLTFTLNGISKTIGLPQMKLGWIVVSGESLVASEAVERLEILCDTFLSVNTPVQVALPQLLNIGQTTRQSILDRIKTNYALLCDRLNPKSKIQNLKSEGGWNAILRVPRTRTDEEWSIKLLEETGVYLYPGYYFELEEGHLVVSLLPTETMFRSAIQIAHEYILRRG